TLLANLSVKLFFGNSSVETNEYAADVFARDITEMGSGGAAANDGRGIVNTGWTEQEQYQVRPVEFTRLRSGGGLVDSSDYKGGGVSHATGPTGHKPAFRHTEFPRGDPPPCLQMHGLGRWPDTPSPQRGGWTASL